MGFNTILALFTTRFALQALGVTDFGLFSVLGSIISFMGVFNTIMLSTCNRFLAVAIGQNNNDEINKTFNINLVIFIGCAIILFIVGFLVGDWYIRNYINYEGPFENVISVFYMSLIALIFSTIAIPYNGLMIAKERFLFFSIVDVVIHIVRFLMSWILIYVFTQKLFIYTIVQAFTIAIPTLLYYMYCKGHFPSIVKFHLVRDKHSYVDVFKFSGWVAYGAVASVIRNQAAALLVNSFFNTMVNAALGIANSLNTYVMMFANNLTQPIQPQITKSYAVKNFKRTDELLVMSTKYSFLLMLFIGSPFLIGADWILKFWLGDVPDYAVSFTILLIVDNLIVSFNSGLSTVLFADGRIAMYQVVINTLRVVAVLIAYFVLKNGAEPPTLFYIYIFFSVLIVLSTQWCLHKTLNYNIEYLFKHSYLPSLTVLLFFLPIVLLLNSLHPFIHITIALLYLAILVYVLGFSKIEKKYLTQFIKTKFNR